MNEKLLTGKTSKYAGKIRITVKTGKPLKNYL